MPNASVTRQHPLEAISKQRLHRMGLLRPGIPANIAEGRQGMAFGRPSQVVTGKKHLAFVKQNLVASCVTGSGNDDDIVIDANRFLARNDPFDLDSADRIALMHHTRTVEMLCKPSMVGNIIPMGKEHERDPSHLFDAPYQWRSEPRRIHQDITARLRRPDDEVCPGAEAQLRGIATEIDAISYPVGESHHPFASIAPGNRADRRRRTRDECHQRPAHLARILRLMIDAGLSAMIPKGFRRDLAAGVTVDAARVNVEVAADILRKALCDLRHRWFNSRNGRNAFHFMGAYQGAQTPVLTDMPFGVSAALHPVIEKLQRYASLPSTDRKEVS